MSRHELPADSIVSPEHNVTVGWDNPLQTFFAVVTNRETSEADDDEGLVAWLGTNYGEIRTVTDLTERLAPHARIDLPVAERLQQERVAHLDRAPTPLQRMVLKTLTESQRQQNTERELMRLFAPGEQASVTEHEIPPADVLAPALGATVGWDNMMESFYAIITTGQGHTGIKSHGDRRQEIPTVAGLAARIATHARIGPELATALRRDRDEANRRDLSPAEKLGQNAAIRIRFRPEGREK